MRIDDEASLEWLWQEFGPRAGITAAAAAERVPKVHVGRVSRSAVPGVPASPSGWGACLARLALAGRVTVTEHRKPNVQGLVDHRHYRLVSRLVEVKIWPEHFRAHMRALPRAWELRREDRHRFAVGDCLAYREWAPDCGGGYTGRTARVLVTDVLRGVFAVGDLTLRVPEGCALLSVRALGEVEAGEQE